MNSLNILSARVSPPQTPAPSRSNSYGNFLTPRRSSADGENTGQETGEVEEVKSQDAWQTTGDPADVDEKLPLLSHAVEHPHVKTSGWHIIPERFANAIVESIRWMLSTIAAPGVYLIAFLYDEDDHFAPLSPLRKLSNVVWGSKRSSGLEKPQGVEDLAPEKRRRSSRKASRAKTTSHPVFSDTESERDRAINSEDGHESEESFRRRRSNTSEPDEIAPARRSIRIKLHNDESLRKRKRKSQSTAKPSTAATPEISPASLKSPTQGASSLLLTKYPRAPAPPRPLIPRRMPSYSLGEPGNGQPTKTLVLDLDETLIHSMAKGGRMSTGHMVEVKLNTYIGVSGQASVGPQHPILYYVHKRPHCDDFLRRVCKWYNLVVFTASVQEYADPVIDWLEQERKFFSGRYYRQHCTYRHGAFIKDLSSVEPDLSKVMILDNSPLSYMFHQDNAIPIEGWISDPTDNDLLHLVPLLEGLQYVTDVRALLALRGGEDGKHMIA